jgi:hypothetical protein
VVGFDVEVARVHGFVLVPSFGWDFEAVALGILGFVAPVVFETDDSVFLCDK